MKGLRKMAIKEKWRMEKFTTDDSFALSKNGDNHSYSLKVNCFSTDWSFNYAMYKIVLEYYDGNRIYELYETRKGTRKEMVIEVKTLMKECEAIRTRYFSNITPHKSALEKELGIKE